MQHRGDQTTEDDNQNSEEIQPQAGDTQRGKKARAHLNTDSVDEQDQTKFLNEMQHRAAQGNPRLIDKVADDNPTKQHAANTKTDAANFDITNPQPDHRHQSQYADRQCYITHSMFPVNNINNTMDYV